MVDGKPVILFYDATDGALKFIKADEANGSAWTGVPVVLDGGSGSCRNAFFDV